MIWVQVATWIVIIATGIGMLHTRMAYPGTMGTSGKIGLIAWVVAVIMAITTLIAQHA